MRNRRRVERSTLLRSPALVVALLALFLAFGDTLVHAYGGSPSDVHACIDNATGTVLVLAESTERGSKRFS